MTKPNAMPLRIEMRNRVLTLIVDDPPWNRMTFAYMDALERAVADAATDPEVRALVFTGEGEDNFSVGMDLKQLMYEPDSHGGTEAILDQRLRVLSMIESLDKPSIATPYGFCLGGGLELMLA